ncbi:class I SAM-dependent methyltransferase [Antrihabitans cavernicola]|uniref:Class I SAM-dependent methyltransferase n=2 Tax=Antrihabitans cavernicola TaxID=2495913 RepID=A0A5A7SG68_9NOCA|nr:class I SAM-dependent methyltransferase [Spelaeibacter cavernicola]
MHESNRLSWNAVIPAHNSHKGDQAAFLRGGGSTLFPEELDLLGPLHGVELLHLQCNAGQDTLSLASSGADVTGVDISDEAIEFARTLSEESGIVGEFYRGDVYDWLADAIAAGRSFDVVYVSYGAVCWLSDLAAWAAGIAGVLRPGGRLVVVEFHPFAAYFDENWQPAYGFGAPPFRDDDGVHDYVADSGDGLTPAAPEPGVEDFVNPHPAYLFTWGLGDIVTAIVRAGLVVEQLVEYPYANGWQGFANMRDLGDRRYATPEGMPDLPLMFGLTGRRR